MSLFQLIGLFYIFVKGFFLYVIEMRIMKPREFRSIKMGLCICISDCFDILRFVRKIIPNRLTTLRMRVMNPIEFGSINMYVYIYMYLYYRSFCEKHSEQANELEVLNITSILNMMFLFMVKIYIHSKQTGYWIFIMLHLKTFT